MVASQQTLHDLPATSQVLFEVLELCQRPNTPIVELATAVQLDPVLCATLLSMGAAQVDLNDPEHGILEQIVAHLGVSAVQSITLDIARRLCQQPQSAEQQAFMARLWRRMILAAKLGSAFAILTKYKNPGEAYLAGLLQGLGHLRIIAVAASEPGLLRMDSDEQAIVDAERSLFSEDHCQWAFSQVRQWNMPGFLADAIRYQAQGIDQVADAHPLVRISSLVAQLASPRFDVVNNGLEMARQLYGIDPKLCEEILSQARGETQRTAAELSIQAQSDFSPQPMLALGRLVDDLLHIQTIFSSLNEDKLAGESTRSIFARVLQQALGTRDFRVLRYDGNANRLLGFSNGGDVLADDGAVPDWHISLRPARSTMAIAYEQVKPRFFHQNAEEATVADQQLLDMLGQPAALCLPVRVDESRGVLVVAGGLREAIAGLAGRGRYLQLLSAILARLLGEKDDLESSLSAAGQPGEPGLNIRELVHEVSNPLSIVNNYLGILAHKLEQQGVHYSELEVMGEELSRATSLLRQWSLPVDTVRSSTHLDLNVLVERVVDAYRPTRLEPEGVQLKLDLDPLGAEVKAEEGPIQQVLRNLLGNAIEAVAPGGQVSISTTNEVYMDSGEYVAILIADNGPGIAHEIRENIFSPVLTTKGEGHSGLGLSIVKGLVDKLHGKIAFRTGPGGTEFQVYLPK